MTIEVIDSHTEGEPTRVIVGAYPPLNEGTMAQRRARFAAEFDHVRIALTHEPRGSEIQVGALLCEPHEPDCVAGVVFFNNAGYLGMCGHGTIGVVKTLEHMGKLKPGRCRIDTPVGVVEAELHASGEVTIFNVPAYRYLKDVKVSVGDRYLVWGDVAWGGNWFFITHHCPVPMEYGAIEAIDGFAKSVQRALDRDGITGAEGARIDHIEICVDSPTPGMDSRNYVLCPGGQYDRSPCGTGTSAHMACLYEDGTLKEGEEWRQESIIGTHFVGSVRLHEGKIVPSIRGRAYICAESKVILDDADPLVGGIR